MIKNTVKTSKTVAPVAPVKGTKKGATKGATPAPWKRGASLVDVAAACGGVLDTLPVFNNADIGDMAGTKLVPVTEGPLAGRQIPVVVLPLAQALKACMNSAFAATAAEALFCGADSVVFWHYSAEAPKCLWTFTTARAVAKLRTPAKKAKPGKPGKR